MNRYGKIIVISEYVYKYIEDIASSLNLQIIESEYVSKYDTIIFTCTSPYFDEVLPDENIPVYTLSKDLSGNFIKTNGYTLTKV